MDWRLPQGLTRTERRYYALAEAVRTGTLRKKDKLLTYSKPQPYEMTYLPKHPRANSTGHVLTHRLVAEYHHGRLAFYGPRSSNNDVVHHIDHNPLNNDPTNLAIMPAWRHLRLHNRPPM